MLNLILSVILIICVVIIFLLYKLLIIQFKKISYYESIMIDYENWVKNVRDSVKSTYIKMRRIDDKELFFKDDDVGFVFSELLSVVDTLNKKIEE